MRADSLEAVIWLEIEKALTSPELLLAGLEAISEEDYTPELEVIKTKLAHYNKEKRRCWRAYEVTGDLETFKVEIKEIDAQLNALKKRHREIAGLIETSEQRPNPNDIKSACDAIYNNLGNLQYEDRRLALEALKVKVYVGEPIRIEGALPIELTPSRRGER
jgi:DNA repair exonuclease SbcCD ATPase subunit